MSFSEIVLAIEGLRDALDEFGEHPGDNTIRARLGRELDRLKRLYAELRSISLGSYQPRRDAELTFQRPWIDVVDFFNILKGTFRYDYLAPLDRSGVVSELSTVYRFRPFDLFHKISDRRYYLQLDDSVVHNHLSALIRIPRRLSDKNLDNFYKTSGDYINLFILGALSAVNGPRIESMFKLHFSD